MHKCMSTNIFRIGTYTILGFDLSLIQPQKLNKEVRLPSTFKDYLGHYRVDMRSAPIVAIKA